MATISEHADSVVGSDYKVVKFLFTADQDVTVAIDCLGYDYAYVQVYTVLSGSPTPIFQGSLLDVTKWATIAANTNWLLTPTGSNIGYLFKLPRWFRILNNAAGEYTIVVYLKKNEN